MCIRDRAKIVHIDIDRSEIDKNVQTYHHIIGDARRVLELLNKKLPRHDYPEWNNYVLSMKAVSYTHLMLPMAVLPSILALSRFILLERASTRVISSMVCIRAVLASRARVRLAR